MSAPVVGFVGFGEAGSGIAAGLVEGGVECVAWDVLLEDDARRGEIWTRAETVRVEVADDLEDLARRSDIVVSTVVASRALEAARTMTAFLGGSHLYVDLNSVGPARKREIAAAVESTGAGFVEGAVMGPVPAHGHRVPILLAGAHAEALCGMLEPYGMRLTSVGTEVGPASTTKMLRSALIKGTEALLFECRLAARAAGVEERVFASASATMGFDWGSWAEYAMGRLARHADRRAQEMREVSETLRELGVEPIVVDAAARRISRAAEQPPAEEGA